MIISSSSSRGTEASAKVCLNQTRNPFEFQRGLKPNSDSDE